MLKNLAVAFLCTLLEQAMKVLLVLLVVVVAWTRNLPTAKNLGDVSRP